MNNQEGSELVEFALAFPILMMFLIGTFELGRAWNMRETMDRAAREGAREIVMTTCALCSGANLSSQDILTEYVAPAMRASSLDPAKVSKFKAEYVFLDPSFKTQCGVEVSYHYPMDLMVPFLPKETMSLDLETRVRMRLETQVGMAGCSGSL